MKIKIHNALAVWSRPSHLRDGMVVDVIEFDNHEHKYFIGKDVEGLAMYVDACDFLDSNASVEEYGNVC